MKKFIVSTVAVLGMLSLSACGKVMEPFQDAERGAQNTAPADTVNFPDGFSNVATKCDNGNRVYVLYHGNEAYGAVSVVPNDPTCKSQP